MFFQWKINIYLIVIPFLLNLNLILLEYYLCNAHRKERGVTMEIWILVIVLLVVGIILLLASLFTSRDSQEDDSYNEYMVQQSEELYQIKSRLSTLEQDGYDNNNYYQDNQSVQVNESAEAVEIDDSKDVDDVTDNEHEEIIRLYSQGYTMHEISQTVQLKVATVQDVIDNYIENR